MSLWVIWDIRTNMALSTHNSREEAEETMKAINRLYVETKDNYFIVEEELVS